jgi:hypothetical protein
MPDTDTQEAEGLIAEYDLQLVPKAEISLEQMFEGCLLLGVDPDDVFSDGGSVKIPDLPPFPQTIEFFEAVVENSDNYDWEEMPVGHIRAIAAVCVRHFMRACRWPSGAPTT